MAQLSVTLINTDGLRLTVSTATSFRNTAHENAARDRMEEVVNADPQHSRYAPWTVLFSGYVSE